MLSAKNLNLLLIGSYFAGVNTAVISVSPGFQVEQCYDKMINPLCFQVMLGILCDLLFLVDLFLLYLLAQWVCCACAMR